MGNFWPIIIGKCSTKIEVKKTTLWCSISYRIRYKRNSLNLPQYDIIKNILSNRRFKSNFNIILLQKNGSKINMQVKFEELLISLNLLEMELNGVNFLRICFLIFSWLNSIFLTKFLLIAGFVKWLRQHHGRVIFKKCSYLEVYRRLS